MTKLPVVDITDIDENAFFHYTSQDNLSSIAQNGLLPKIGPNSHRIESTEKVFFAIGVDGFLTIMDVWLKWLAVQHNVPKWFSHFGSWYLKVPWTPKLFSNIYLKSFSSSRLVQKRCRKLFKEILDSSVILILDLKENEDFSYNDIDEAKDTFGKKSYAIKTLYPDKNSLNDNKIEYWNMHTFSGKTIPPSKISLLKMDGSSNANEILIKLIAQNPAKCHQDFPTLFKYYQSLTA